MSLDEPSTRPPRNGAGGAALTLGVIAVIFAVVPYVGEFVAVPTAFAAIVLGWIGFERAESGAATNSAQALTGLVLGALAGLVVAFVYLVGLTPD